MTPHEFYVNQQRTELTKLVRNGSLLMALAQVQVDRAQLVANHTISLTVDESV